MAMENHESHERIITLLASFSEILTGAVLIATLVKQDWLIILFVVVLGGATVLILNRMKIPRWAKLLIIFLSVILIPIMWSQLADADIKTIDVQITEPVDGSEVSFSHIIKGKVDDPNARVFVLVHPLEDSNIWVQNQPIVDPDGNWQSIAYFGTLGAGDGDRFEVVALATNDNFFQTFATGNYLRSGQRIRSISGNTNKSDIHTVTRKD